MRLLPEKTGCGRAGTVTSEGGLHNGRPDRRTVLDDYSLTTGAMISPSSPLLDIADLSRLKATLKVPESKIFSVRPGMPVILRFDALPNEEFIGEVTRIDQYVDPRQEQAASR